jgi:hypothetical protein
MVMVRGQLLSLVVMGMEMVVHLQGALLHMLVLASDRPMLPMFMGRGLQPVVL